MGFSDIVNHAAKPSFNHSHLIKRSVFTKGSGMTYKTRLVKGLLCATSITAISAGSALAQITPNDFTPAGDSVSNTFTLSYDVGGVTQPPIDTSDPGDPNGPTVFTVDRLINLAVVSEGDTTVVPGAVDRTLVYSVLNTGNDTQGYALSITENGGDALDTTDPVSALETIRYYIDDGDGMQQFGGADGAPIDYDPANPPQLAPDTLIWVVVTQDIPVGASDGDEGEITLTADVLIPTGQPSANSPVSADTGGNTIDGAAENVLADTGNDATESADGSYIVSAADVLADKAVTVFSEDGANCATIPGTATGGYSIPNACVEYVITVTNTGSADATNIDIVDDLPAELEFVAVDFTGFTAGSFSTGLGTFPSTGDDCAVDACIVTFENATLPAPASLPGTTTGTIVIRATVK